MFTVEYYVNLKISVLELKGRFHSILIKAQGVDMVRNNGRPNMERKVMLKGCSFVYMFLLAGTRSGLLTSETRVHTMKK